MKVKAGDTLTFRGVVWNEGWDFDAPVIIYEPVCSYRSDGSICEAAIEQAVEDICIKLVLGDDVRTEWSPQDMKEFTWRGWNPNRFSKRKRAVHASFVVTFFDGHDEMGLDFSIEPATTLATRQKEKKP